jgi:hypothetical protein
MSLPETDFYTTSETTVVTESTKHAYGEPKLKKRTYQMRYRTDKTDLAKVQSIIKELLSDPGKIETSLLLEKSPAGEAKNSFDLVACYSVLLPID